MSSPGTIAEPPALDAVVIGAGIAGLAAAYRLQQQGRRVVVLEATDRVGGRMSSALLEGHVVDRGAQFLSSGYEVLARLLAGMGMADSVQPTSPRCAIVRGGKPRVMRVTHPIDALTSGLLSLPGFLAFGWRTWRARHALAGLSLSNYSDWASFDDRTALAWLGNRHAREACDYFLDPLLQGFYFQAPDETSRALALAVIAYGFQGKATTTLAGGLGRLPDALASRLDVRLDSPVRRVEQLQDHVRVELVCGVLQAKHAVIAVPAPDASKMLEPAALDEAASELLATPYSASINISMLTDDGFKLPRALADVYGLLIPESERTHVAAVGIENNKRRGAAAPGHLFNAMFCHASATRLMHEPDQALVSETLRCLEPLLPSLPGHVVGSHVIRWPAAEPLSWVGRAAAIRRYRDLQKTKPASILLAGDYMGMPFTEGAAESGEWAAQAILSPAPRTEAMP